MSENRVSPERLRELLSYDDQTGNFVWKKLPSSRCWRRQAGDVAGWVNPISGYVFIGIDGRQYPAHRLAFLYLHGVWPTGEVDHVDGNRANNRFSNLRDVPSQTNRENQRRAHADGTSGLLGVTWRQHAKKWSASICVDGNRMHLGYRQTKEEAHSLYLEAKRRLHSGCTI
jgi:hypothetical protein